MLLKFVSTVQSIQAWFWHGGVWITSQNVFPSGWGGAAGVWLSGIVPARNLKYIPWCWLVNICVLLYGCVSQGLGTTEFTNLIGWNRYWPRSRFSRLDRHIERLHFAVKKLQTKNKNIDYFLPNFGRMKLSSSPFARKMSACTNQLH